jgi:hypothetical protein
MEEAVNTHSNARFAREVEGNVSGTRLFQGRGVDNDFSRAPCRLKPLYESRLTLSATEQDD